MHAPACHDVFPVEGNRSQNGKEFQVLMLFLTLSTLTQEACGHHRPFDLPSRNSFLSSGLFFLMGSPVNSESSILFFGLCNPGESSVPGPGGSWKGTLLRGLKALHLYPGALKRL